MSYSVVTGFFLLLLAAPAVYGATTYTVGDDAGWDSGVDYTAWVSGKSFVVGDSLKFDYNPTHKVDEVSKTVYDSCAGTALESHGGTTVTIPLTEAGTKYFICPTAGHCANGMKLAVTVTTSSTPTATPPPSTPSGSPPTDNPTSPGTGGSTTSPPPPPPNGSDGVAIGMNVAMVVATLLLAYFVV